MDANTIDQLFRSTLKETAADRVVKEAESEFKCENINTSVLTAKREKEMLLEKKRMLEKKHASIKNVKNLRLMKNGNPAAIQRSKIRAKIGQIEERLLEIEIECKGATVENEKIISSSSNVESTSVRSASDVRSTSDWRDIE